MRPFYSFKFLAFLILAGGLSPNVFAQITTSFGYTGSVQTYNVPTGCTSVLVRAGGDQGGQAGDGGPSYGGCGGIISCTLTVTPLTTLELFVGGVGTNNTCCGTASGVYNGGGNGYEYAGGGGGAYNYCCDEDHGGNGGGLTGQNGYRSGSNVNGSPISTTTIASGGGTPVAGGVGGTYSSSYAAGVAGSLLNGGNGGSTGAGGGGWYGGGGSSFTDPVLVAPGAINSQGGNCGAGYIAITPLVPSILDSPGTALSFPNTVVGDTSGPMTFYIGGGLLSATGTLTVTAPPGFIVSSGGAWGACCTVSFTTRNFNAIGFPIQVKFVPNAYSAFANNVSISGGDVATTFQPVGGKGILGCYGEPTVTGASVTPSSGGSGSSFTLSLLPAATTGGITYQWYEYTSTLGTFITMPGATTANFTFTGVTSNAYFYCVATCSASGLSTVSPITMVTYAPSASNCTGAPTTGSLTSTISPGCAPSYGTLVGMLGEQVGPDISYSWQVSTTSATTGFSVISGQTSPFYSPTVSGTFWVQGLVTCNEGADPTRGTPVIQLTLNPQPLEFDTFLR